MSRVQTLTVEEGDGDQRLDRWFKRLFPQITQGRIEKMCRKGEIRVDGGRVKGLDPAGGGPAGAHPAAARQRSTAAAQAHAMYRTRMPR